MPTVGQGVYEIRIRTDVEYRVLYIAKFAEGVYVLHVFGKKTRRTSKPDLDVARTRLSALARERRDFKIGYLKPRSST